MGRCFVPAAAAVIWLPATPDELQADQEIKKIQKKRTAKNVLTKREDSERRAKRECNSFK